MPLRLTGALPSSASHVPVTNAFAAISRQSAVWSDAEGHKSFYSSQDLAGKNLKCCLLAETLFPIEAMLTYIIDPPATECATRIQTHRLNEISREAPHAR